MHACSSIIEHNLHSIQQSFPSTHPLLLSTSSSAVPQLQVSTSHQLSASLNHPTTISNQSIFSTSSTINNHLLNPIEIRLFHTLHYLILYSNENNDQLLSLNIIQLFIYLFIPYIHTYLRNNEKEFLSNSDLNQGMRLIWQPLFKYHQPNIHIFNAFIKPIILSNNQQEQRFSIENNNQHHCLSIQKFTVDKQPLSDLTHIKIKKEQKSNTFILVDSDSTTPTIHDSTNDLDGYGIVHNNNNIKTRAPLVDMNSICSTSDLSRLTISPQTPG